jgi:DNA-directed RNA polymerase sigma subunit (sigma70/sigma32)
LAEANLGVVVAIAERHPRGNMYLLGLVQKGNTAVLIALQTFPDHPNLSFSAHAAGCVECRNR